MEKITIIFSQLGFFYRDANGNFLEDNKPAFIPNEVLEALEGMSVFYDDLDFEGYWDGKVFIITKVINNFDGSELTNDDLDEMMYIAPEGAHNIIKITDQETGIVLDMEL